MSVSLCFWQFVVVLEFLWVCSSGLVWLWFGGAIEIGLVDLHITDDKDDVLPIKGVSSVLQDLYNLCLVGCFPTASVVHFPSMRNTFLNICYPLEGIPISNLGEKRFLFHFFHRVDIEQVFKGALWTFNNHLLVFHHLKRKEDLILVPLVYSYFWVQVHDLPLGIDGRKQQHMIGSPGHVSDTSDSTGVCDEHYLACHDTISTSAMG
ncbi:hypothetical protein Goshw_029654 [Gossypium schwendimanii]|uniref:DUF4283 domain-containing protein n=1 Tax=Gossypium schwendimanii TaxID=34291 RepID=A0A7J9KNY5_GOSSC|nr:hypothetical protein [Gossypium schwendimanii]